ncbi:MAG: peptidase M14 [Bacteroidetes bacterium]|nr:peptidase M14 [Bacteroidota bacterium]
MKIFTMRSLIMSAFFTLFFVFTAIAQPLHEVLNKRYSTYQEASITHRRFKHSDIVPLIKKMEDETSAKVTVEGHSVEGRAIYMVRIGTGPVNVLLWSQMHGDEPSATMAIMDIFNFFSKNGALDEFRDLLQNELSLYFIPMLNPDGAERFRRRNALQIDLNRDALRLQTPEAQILKRVRDELDAEWGFNLHDQSRYYTAGIDDHTATVSFLAPAFNYEKEVNKVRADAMKLITSMNEVLQYYIPGKVAKYSDDFEPRAFGDNIQKWGTSTILIESGALKGDVEKQYIRQLNFVALLSAFEAIATKSYENNDITAYDDLPFNERYLHDLIIRNVFIEKDDKKYLIDIGFRRTEVKYDENPSIYYRSQVADIGDLSTFHGYEELDGKSYTISSGKLFQNPYSNTDDLENTSIWELLQDGFTEIQVEGLSPDIVFQNLPIRLVTEKPSYSIAVGSNPSFFLKKDGHNRYVIVNGFVFDLIKDREKIKSMKINLE